MRRLICFAPMCAVVLLLASSAMAGTIQGDYVEARSADVYVGHCFANSEAGLTGNQATIAWRVRQGEWNQETLDGLSVVAVVKAQATLGDPFGNPYPAKAVLFVDQKANEKQRAALIAFAKTMGGSLLENVVSVQTAPISMQVDHGEDHGAALLRVGKLARIQTRALGNKDHQCGMEMTYYQPLTELSHAMPVYTIADEFQGTGLDSAWRLFDKRSAFIGTFSR